MLVKQRCCVYRAKIIATGANVQDVSHFSVTRISQLNDTNEVTVEVEIPVIKIDSEVEMHGKVSIPFAPAINDKGPVHLNFTDLKLAATVQILANADGTYNIGTVTIDSWSFASVKIQLDNLLGGGTFGKAANKLLNKIFPTIVENDRPKINRRLENVLKNLFNAYLDGIGGKTSADLSAKLVEISELFRSAMKAGRADINIPVMDPAVLETVSVKVDKWPI
ncbi:Protein translocase subunit, partial [Frankliniella fusca]